MREARPPVGHGVIEGFYGRPWTAEARLDVVRQVGAVGLDTYVWAPKSDPTHRAAWSEPLAPERLRELGLLAEVAETAGVRVHHGLSPVGIAARRGGQYVTDDAAAAALRRRVADVRGAGVTRFVLLFDDTWPTFLPSAASRALGEAHGRVAALVRDWLADRADASVLLVPAIYHRRAPELPRGGLSYLLGIASVVGREVPVAWTGPAMFSTWISGSDLARMERATGLRLWIWNNAVANDWLPLVTSAAGKARRVQRLSSGPVANLSADAVRGAAGVLLNGAREAELTRVAVTAFAEQIRAPDAYDPVRSWEDAIERVFAEAAPPVRELLDLVRGHPLASPHLTDGGLADLLASSRRGSPRAQEDLRALLDRLATLDERLATALGAHPAAPELAPTAREIGERGVAAARAALLGHAAPRAPRARWTTALDDGLALVRRRRFG